METGKLSEYNKTVIKDLSEKVLQKIAKNYGNLRKGVSEAMGGYYIITEARKQWDMGVEAGISQGENLINQLNIRLAKAGRADDIVRSAEDTDYQKELLREFGLIPV